MKLESVVNLDLSALVCQASYADRNHSMNLQEDLVILNFSVVFAANLDKKFSTKLTRGLQASSYF
jgi:hypothetical protein